MTSMQLLQLAQRTWGERAYVVRVLFTAAPIGPHYVVGNDVPGGPEGIGQTPEDAAQNAGLRTPEAKCA